MDGGFPTVKRGCRVNQQLGLTGGHQWTVQYNHWIPDGEKRILPLIILRNNTQGFLCCWHFIMRLFFSHEKKSIMLNHAWSPWVIGPRPRIWTPTQPMRMRGPSSFTISIESSVRKRLNLLKTKRSTPPINTMTLQSNPPPGAGLYPGLTCYTAGRVGELIDSCDLFFTRDHETCH